MYRRSLRYLGQLRPTLYKYGFYDLVMTGSHRSALEDLPSSLQQDSNADSKELTAEERIAKVFGGRIKGEDRVSSSRVSMGEPRIIAGVKVPDKPQEPDNCCMSGCINCVWEIYNDDIKDWEAKRRSAAKNLVQKGGVWPADFHPPVKLLRPENLPESLRGHESAASKIDDAWTKVPVEMRVFAELEKKIKGRKRVSQPSSTEH